MRRRKLKGARGRIACGAIGAATVLLAVCAGPVGATGSYPGETLSLAQSGPAIAGQVTHFVATGQQTDVNDYAGGFSLEVFAKNTDVDPTCSASYPGEQQASTNDPYEQWIVIGSSEGSDASFSVPFQFVFPRTGQVILCAYSAYITDTAAAASLVVNITSASAPPTKPVNTKAPRITQSGRTLRCTQGRWTGATHFAYAWRAKGHPVAGAHGQRLTIAKALTHHTVVCQVSATNTAGTTTASSPAFHVR